MRAEVVAVGTELLLGQILDTNAREIGQRLAAIGIDVLFGQTVGDEIDRIARCLELALSRSDVVIVTGGLGPTQDDVTREAIARVAGVRLRRRPELEDLLRERFARAGREMPLSNLVQADVPEGARPILQERGTAPGLVVDIGDRRIYAVPGVPREMDEMLTTTIVPELAAASGPSAIVSRIVRCVGIAESRVAELVDDLFRGSANPSIAFLAGGGEVKVRVTAKASTEQDAGRLLAPVVDEVVARVGEYVTSASDEDLETVVGRLLRASRRTLATAESLTAGSVAARLAGVAGASDYLRGGVVAYQVDVKRDVLGVRTETIEGPGVVSAECAAEMAFGVRRALGADLGVALTGAAGPEPHDGAAPGTVWVALDGDDVAHRRRIRAPGDRTMIVRWSEQAALDLVRRHLEGIPLPESDRVVH
ncbi:MAG TPA: competence/damage-inducible protein A [Actinomycetota bacterium]|nr:competence/damage-inducible protein A [Actinomycetota bacterium]